MSETWWGGVVAWRSHNGKVTSLIPEEAGTRLPLVTGVLYCLYPSLFSELLGGCLVTKSKFQSNMFRLELWDVLPVENIKY